MGNPEVVIVGAGAAGIGAGLELQARGIPFVIVEAAGRAGGRGFTDAGSLPLAWDQGCHWLHCADVNPLVPWADRLGASYVRRTPTGKFTVWKDGSWPSDAERIEANAQLAAAYDAVYAASAGPGDIPVSEAIGGAGRWAPAARHLLRLMSCEDPERVSARGYGEYRDTGANWPVRSGYGDLIARMAAGLPIRFGAEVSRISQRTEGVRVETSGGSVEARAAIVTASTNVLLSGAIGFDAGPARDLLDLMQEVPCGSYEKVALVLRKIPEEIADERFFVVDPGEDAAVLGFEVAASGQPLLIAHMAGGRARDLSRAGAPAMIAAATECLAMALGAQVRDRIMAAAATGWQANPFVRGGYSYVKPGCAGRRHAMIAADTGNVAFAGEAFSRHWQATAHGAYQSGRDTAARLAGALKPG